MPVLAMVGSAAAGQVGAAAVKGGFKLGAWAKQLWSNVSNSGFTLTSGKWSLWKRQNSIGAAPTMEGVTGMNSTTLIALGIGAYLLFKR